MKRVGCLSPYPQQLSLLLLNPSPHPGAARQMGTGDSLVSFVFGLEVTWDLLQVQLEEEAEGDEKTIIL